MIRKTMSFRIPEQYRVTWREPKSGYIAVEGDDFGLFMVPRKSKKLRCIATQGALSGDEGNEWEHVSVSIPGQGNQALPNWNDMCTVKDLFWSLDECVVQYHPPRSTYIDSYPVLHLWRPVNQDIPMPPIMMV